MTAPKENLPDATDRTSLETDRNFMLRIRDRENKLIKMIEEALSASKTIHTRFVKSAMKIFPLPVSKSDRLRRIVLIAKQKKRQPREPLVNVSRFSSIWSYC